MADIFVFSCIVLVWEWKSIEKHCNCVCQHYIYRGER